MGMTLPLGIGFLLSLGHRRPDAAALASGGGAPAAVPPRGSEKRSQQLLFGFVVAVMAGALGLSLSRGGS